MSLSFTVDALGTKWWIEIFDDITEEKRTVIMSDCTLLLSEFENQYSRFRPDSLISQLNRTGTLVNPPTECIDILTYGITLFDRTQGKFNVMVGEKLTAHGYDSSYSFMGRAFTTPLPSPHDSLTLTPSGITLHQGQIDIGGFGKGFIIDVLVAHLKNHHQLSYFLINGGGDMYATTDHEQPVLIYLEHPTRADTYLETTTLSNQGFAASSPHKRQWTSGSTVYTHIITEEAENLVVDATFVKAGTARDADAFATTALILPPTEFDNVAEKEKLGVAQFTISDSTLRRNRAF